MLAPEFLQSAPDRLVELYAKLEIEIIISMARRIAAMDMFTPATEWQYQKLLQMGLLHDEIVTLLSQATGKRRAEIAAIMAEAGVRTIASDRAIYERAGLEVPKIDEALTKVLQAGIERTNGLFDNLTKTTAATATGQFEAVLDNAYMKVSTGAFSYIEATTEAVKSLSRAGVGAVKYPSGHVDGIEVATRRAVVTGVNQNAARMQLTLAREMGVELMQTSAHIGARTTPINEPANHESWQGRVFSVNWEVMPI